MQQWAPAQGRQHGSSSCSRPWGHGQLLLAAQRVTAPQLPRLLVRAQASSQSSSSSTSVQDVSTLTTDRDSERQQSGRTGQEQSQQRVLQQSKASTSNGGGSDDDNEPEQEDGGYQIGLDPFTQQLLLAALTMAGAAGLSWSAGVDLSNAARVDDLGLALETGALCSLPALCIVALLAVVPWGAKSSSYAAPELLRLQQNFFLTSQVLKLYWIDDEDTDEEEGSGSNGSSMDSSSSSSSSSIKSRVKRQLKLESTMSWTTLSSALTLMQAYIIQPWNPPAPPAFATLTLAGRALALAANEAWVRGALYGVIAATIADGISNAGTDSALFFVRFVGAGESSRWLAGALLMGLTMPLTYTEARRMQDFVRASVVGPVRDAALFCTGDGIDEPAYCDPQGFAIQAAKNKRNKAQVADVVTKTRGWMAGASASLSSLGSLSSVSSIDVSSMDCMDINDTSRASSSLPAPSTSHSNSSQQQPSSSASSASTSTSHTQSPEAAVASTSSSSGTSNMVQGQGGVTVNSTPAEFDAEDDDMGVLLKVETLQDRIAFGVWGMYCLASVAGINAAFLASGNNLIASMAAAWLIREAPLLATQVTLQARAAAQKVSG